MWDEYLKSGRHEVAEFAIMPYDSFLGEMARKQATGKPPNLVLCGAFCLASKPQGCKTFLKKAVLGAGIACTSQLTPDNAITKRRVGQ